MKYSSVECHCLQIIFVFSQHSLSFFFFWELKRMQNIPHRITEFLSEIILSQREPNARYEICKSFRDRLEVPHQHIIV